MIILLTLQQNKFLLISSLSVQKTMGTYQRNNWMCYTEIMNDEFILTQTEYAKIIGVSRECLRTRRRTGKLEGEYKVINGCYFFKRPRPNIENTTPKKPPMKQRRRGQHYRSLVSDESTNYPNWKMQQHNEIKMMTALKSSVSREELDLIPVAIHQIKEQRKKELQRINEERERSKQIYKKNTLLSYGRGIYNCKTQQPKWTDMETFENNVMKPKKIYKYYDI